MRTDAHVSQQKGTIEGLRHGRWIVNLDKPVGCAVCHRGLCWDDADHKVVKVKDEGQSFDVGQHVWVRIEHTVGLRAVMMFYGFPFLLKVSVLLLLLCVGVNEGWAAVGALGSLVPYYFVLRSTRHRWSEQMTLQLALP